jgi:ribosome biogenesis protein MAK21
MLTDPEAMPEDEEEHYVDAPEDGEDVSKPENATSKLNSNAYNPRKREPEFSNADRSCLWELIPLAAHHHPSVSLFASRILQSQPFDKQKPDPSTFTLIHFLDRFIYRNARTKASGLRGSSLMQPLAGTSAADLLIKDRTAGRTEDALNTEGFWSKKRDDVRADEVFFHDYFDKAGKAQRKSRAEKRSNKTEDGGESTDEEEEGQIWKALVGSRPEIEDGEAEIDDDDEDDMDIADFMDEDDEDDQVENLEKDSDEGGDSGVALDGMEGVSFHGFGDEEEVEDGEEGREDAEVGAEASDDEFDVTALEDDDEGALFGSDEEVPEGVILPAIEDVAKDLKSKDKKKRKKSIRSLPTFASAEDYAKLIGDDDDDEDL